MGELEHISTILNRVMEGLKKKNPGLITDPPGENEAIEQIKRECKEAAK